MVTPDTARDPADLTPLAMPNGGFAMLAIDQRVSLETMFVEAGRDPSTDALHEFRQSVLTALAPHASAVLVERTLVERSRPLGLGVPPPGLDPRGQ